MKIAYADPPYIGCAKRHYSDDPRCAEVDHAELIARLVRDYDGWALSCSQNSLRTLLPMCPERARVAVWLKTFSAASYCYPAYCWEPVIYLQPRKASGIKGPRRDVWVRDWISCPIIMPGTRYDRKVRGAKPPEFCYWMFEILLAEPGDSFDDLYPGSGIVTDCWNAFCKRPVQEGLFAKEST